MASIKNNWYWERAQNMEFKGFVETDYCGRPTGWVGPFRTFTECKADALKYYQALAVEIHQTTSRIKAMKKPEVGK